MNVLFLRVDPRGVLAVGPVRYCQEQHEVYVRKFFVWRLDGEPLLVCGMPGAEATHKAFLHLVRTYAAHLVPERDPDGAGSAEFRTTGFVRSWHSQEFGWPTPPELRVPIARALGFKIDLRAD